MTSRASFISCAETRVDCASHPPVHRSGSQLSISQVQHNRSSCRHGSSQYFLLAGLSGCVTLSAAVCDRPGQFALASEGGGWPRRGLVIPGKWCCPEREKKRTGQRVELGRKDVSKVNRKIAAGLGRPFSATSRAPQYISNVRRLGPIRPLNETVCLSSWLIKAA
jgi:hypothetical protein